MTKHLHFEFSRGEEDKICDYVNARLTELSLSQLSIAPSSGYFKETTSYSPDGDFCEHYFEYGFDELDLEGEGNDEDQSYDWRFGIDAFDREDGMDAEVFRHRWLAEHPDRVIRLLQHRCSDRADAFVFLHHERVA